MNKILVKINKTCSSWLIYNWYRANNNFEYYLFVLLYYFEWIGMEELKKGWTDC